jgi:hypothetical protein
MAVCAAGPPKEVKPSLTKSATTSVSLDMYASLPQVKTDPKDFGNLLGLMLSLCLICVAPSITRRHYPASVFVN